jgi:hypothetical protein
MGGVQVENQDSSQYLCARNRSNLCAGSPLTGGAVAAAVGVIVGGYILTVAHDAGGADVEPVEARGDVGDVHEGEGDLPELVGGMVGGIQVHTVERVS